MITDLNIALPSKPKIIKEEGTIGVYEIDGLYPGYGHTLGNSLRRIILSSLPGTAITHLKIDGVNHEFSTLKGVREDVISIILNLKKVKVSIATDESQTLTLQKKGPGIVTAGDFSVPGQVEIINKDQYLFELTDKSSEIDLEVIVEFGLGFVSKEMVHKDRVDVGGMALDAIFSPIKRVNYEVENMRVGDRTDFNQLRIFIDTDGTISPKEALEKSIEIMIHQLKAIVGFKEEIELPEPSIEVVEVEEEKEELDKEALDDFLKTRIEQLDLSARTTNSLIEANIRTVGGIARKKEEDLNDIPGLGDKGISEIKDVLKENGIELK